MQIFSVCAVFVLCFFWQTSSIRHFLFYGFNDDWLYSSNTIWLHSEISTWSDSGLSYCCQQNGDCGHVGFFAKHRRALLKRARQTCLYLCKSLFLYNLWNYKSIYELWMLTNGERSLFIISLQKIDDQREKLVYHFLKILWEICEDQS